MNAIRSGRVVLGALGTAAAAWVLSVTVVGQAAPPAQAPAAPAAGRGPMAEEVFTNVQLLKGMPVDQFMGTMGAFASATGLNCTDCHIEESGGSWARYADDNLLKRTTRRMMLMTDAINKTNFAGRQVVTCFTCHRGMSRPQVMPSIDLLYSSPLADEPGEPFTPAAGQPPAEQVLDKYLQAVGGAQRLAALNSIVAKGLYIGFDDADKAPMEIFATPQGRTTLVRSASGLTTTVITPTGGWIAAPETDRPVPLLWVTGHELEGAKLEVQAFFPGRIKQALTNWRRGFPTIIDDRDVELVQGDLPGGGVATLAFDSETGLLTRSVRFGNSPVGRIVTRVDYSDYRDVAGVKIPFKWTVAWLNGRSHYELTDAQPNVKVDPARFNRPAPSPRP